MLIEFPFPLTVGVSTGGTINPQTVVLVSTAEHYSNTVDFSILFSYQGEVNASGQAYTTLNWQQNTINPAYAMANAVNSNNVSLAQSCQNWLSNKLTALNLTTNAFVGGVPMVTDDTLAPPLSNALAGSLSTIEKRSTLFQTVYATDNNIFTDASNGAIVTSNVNALKFYLTLNQSLNVAAATSISGVDISGWVSVMPSNILGSHTAAARTIIVTFTNAQTLPGYGE